MLVTVLSIVLAILANVVLHEAGHAAAFRRSGIKIVEAGLGLPYAPRLRVRARGVTWSLSPWLVGAYVRPDADAHELICSCTTPYRTMAWQSHAGVIVNFITAAALAAVSAALSGYLALAGALAGAAILLYLTRHAVAAYLIPPLGLAMFAVFGIGMTLAVAEHGWSTPVGLTSLADLTPGTPSLASAAMFVAVIAAGIGAFNMMPIAGLDGFWVWERWLSGVPVVLATWRAVTLCALVALLVAAVAQDLYRGVTAMFS